MKNIVLSVLTVLFLVSPHYAGNQQPYSFNGYGFWQFGQVIKGNSGGTPINHQWVTNALLGLKFEKKLNERLNILINPEFRLYFPFPELNTNVVTKRANSVAFINDMNGTILFGDVEQPVVEWRNGIFTYKYNENSCDFGEYIYRTGTYPPFVITDFDFPVARLCGSSIRLNPVSGLTVDALFTSELLYAPLYDFSLAFLGKYSPSDAFSAGAGIDFARVLPVSKKKTSPDSTVGLTAIDKIMYRKPDGSFGYYSFKATKLMATLSLDPKPFLPFSDILTKADMKLYGEIALTGFPIKTVADTLFPYNFYGDISRLMPMMFGFNIPVYSLVNALVNAFSSKNIPMSMPEDVLALEFEYFPSRMPNDYHDAMTGQAKPYWEPEGGYFPELYRDREWGWAIYTRKEILPGFSIAAQIAYDHLRMSYVDGSTATNECLLHKGHWYWVSKVGYSF